MSQLPGRFFDITLTSNSYQDIFPDNTVSFFRAKLPSKIVLPRQVPFKVALYKLCYVNSINNVGEGAGTRMQIVTDKFSGTPVHFPDVCVSNQSDLVRLLVAQMKHAEPNLFTNHPNIIVALKPKSSYSIPQIPVNSEEAQADQPMQSDASQNDSWQKEIQRGYNEIFVDVHYLLKILFDPTLTSEEVYLKFRKQFSRSNYARSMEFHDENYERYLREIRKPFYWTGTISLYKKIAKMENRFFQQLDETFFETPFNRQKWEKHFGNLRSFLDTGEEFAERSGAYKNPQGKKIEQDTTIETKNNEGIHESTYIDALKTFRKYNKIFQNPLTKKNEQNVLFGLLIQMAIEIDDLMKLLEEQIILHKEHLYKSFDNPKLYSKIADRLLLLLKLDKYISESFANELQEIERSPKPKIELTQGDSIINPDTQKVFENFKEFDNFVKNAYRRKGNRWEVVKGSRALYTKGYKSYFEKRNKNIITEEMSIDSPALTGDEQYFLWLEKRSNEDRDRLKAEILEKEKQRKMKMQAEEAQIKPFPKQLQPQAQTKQTPETEDGVEIKPSPQQQTPSQAAPPKSQTQASVQLTPPETQPQAQTPPALRPLENRSSQIQTQPQQRPPESQIQTQTPREPPLVKPPEGQIQTPQPQAAASPQTQTPQITTTTTTTTTTTSPQTSQHEEVLEPDDVELSNVITKEPSATQTNVIPQKQVGTFGRNLMVHYTRKRPHDDPSGEEPPAKLDRTEENELEALITASVLGFERESWDNVESYKEFFAFSSSEDKQKFMISQVARGTAPASTYEQAVIRKLNHITRVAKKDFTKSFEFLEIKPTELDAENLQDFQYYLYLPDSKTDWFELIRFLALKRMNLVQNENTVLNNDPIKLQAVSNLVDTMSANFQHPADGVTINWYNLGNMIILKCNSCNFDLGMSIELLSMLGWGKEERFTEDNLLKRQQYRFFLQKLVRLSEQVKTNPYSVSNFFVTGENHLLKSNQSFDYAVNEALGTHGDAIFDANHIKVFKQLFMNKQVPLRLNLQNSTLYKVYMYFLKKTAKIERLDFAWATCFHVFGLENMHHFFNEDEFKEYLSFFYGEDSFIKKLLNKHNEVNFSPILDVDLVTFCLWKCAKEMPLDDHISATVPPKINPLSQIWVYTNIIKDCIVNNNFKKLLAVSTTQSYNTELGRDCEITFQEPIFKPLNTNILDEIEILIATKFGNPVPFIDGPSTVQLVFKVDDF